MKAIILLIFILGASAPSMAGGQNNPVRPTAPVIPRAAAEPDRTALTQAALLVSQGKFDPAEAQLKLAAPAASARVYVDLIPVPKSQRAACRQAAESAITGWTSALAGAQAKPSAAAPFVLTANPDEADILVLFERSAAHLEFGQARLDCGDVKIEVTDGRRTARVYVSLDTPYSALPHSPASLTHLIGKGLGAYLGLGQTADQTGLMGADTHNAQVAVKPAAAEISTVKGIQEARLKLLDFACRKVAAYMPRPVISVEKLELDAGEVWRGDKPHFTFTVKNTGDAPLEIFAKPNCGCTVANFDKVIVAGGSGKVDADLNTAGFRGKIIKSIDVTSNDLASPRLSLHLLANVKSIIAILPAETATVGLKTGEPTIKELDVRISDKEKTQVTKVTCSMPYATAKCEPKGDPGNYHVTVTISPEAPTGRTAFLVTGQTTSAREPNFNVTFICEKGILAMPPSGYLGNIGPNSVLPINQMITLSKRDGEFHVKKLESGDANLEVKQEALPGGQIRLTLAYKGGWPTGFVQRKITVETDDPAQPKIEIPVMANVVAGAVTR